MATDLKNLRLVFMGTPDYAAITLKALVQAGYNVVAVFSQPDKPSGRGQKINRPPCAHIAIENDIPLYQPKTLKNTESTELFKNLKPDLVIVVAYGLFLPKAILGTASIDVVNLHASLLPKYRGAAPIQWALINGETETGVTLMKLNEKMDAGAIYAQVKIPILEEDNQASLFDKCAKKGTGLLLDYIPLIAKKEIQAREQDESQATLARLLSKQDGLLDFNKSATELYHLIKGVSHWPTAYTMIDNKILKIYDAQVLCDGAQLESTSLITQANDAGFIIKCGQGQLLVKEVQLEGKKRISAVEFARGYLRDLPKKLGTNK